MVLSMATIGESQMTDRAHPFLFLTAADVARARESVEQNGALADLARAQRDRALAAKVSDLPAFETDWWTTDQHKPWGETYPVINHHTGEVPRAWARVAQDCAQTSLLYPEPELRGKGKAVLLGLSAYSFVFEHFDVGMNYTTWGAQTLEAYDILHDEFTAEERTRMDAFFDRMVTAVIKNDEFWIEHIPGGPMNNHYAWHKLGRLMYGLFYEKPELVQQALFGPKGVMDSLRHGFTDDGLWLEASLNYQFAQTSPVVLMARLLENAGSEYDLWAMSTDDGRNLKQAYDALIPLLFPDDTLPNIGDCYAHRMHLGSAGDYETLLARFGDPVYAWLLSRHAGRPGQALFQGLCTLPTGEAPALASQLWPEHGYVMLREREGADYWSGQGWTLFATYSNAPVHQNQDKLSVMLFGNGHHWLVDAEGRAGVYHAFSSAMQRELNRATVSHNTILVDGVSQRFPSRRLNLVEYQALPSVKRASLGDLDGRLYDGVRQLRTVIVREDYVLDVFQIESKDEHRYAWLTHVDGTPGESSVGAWTPESLPEESPWPWLRDAEAADVGQEYAETFTHAGQTFRLDLGSDGPVRAIRCAFPRDDSDSPATYAMRLAERYGKTAWFAAVYQLGEGGPSPATVWIEGADLGRYDVRIAIDGRETGHLVPRLAGLR